MLMVVYHSKMLNVNFSKAIFRNFFVFSLSESVRFFTVPLLPLTQSPFLIKRVRLLGGNQQWMLQSRFDVPIIRPYLKCHVSETNEIECRALKLIRHEKTLEGGGNKRPAKT